MSDANTIAQIAGEVSRIVGEVKKVNGETDSRLAAVEQLVAAGFKGGAMHEHIVPLEQAIRSKFLESNALVEFRARGVSTGKVDLGLSVKDLVSTQGASSSNAGAQWDVQANRVPGAYGYGMREFTLMAALTPRPVTSNAVETHQLNGFVPAATTQAAEGDTKAEQDLDPVLVKFPVETIAVFLPISRQLLDDDASVLESMRPLLAHTVIAKAERQVIYGQAASGEMRGFFLDALTHTTTGQTIEDEIGDAAAIMADNGYAPSITVMNPIDWRAVQARKSTVDEHYVLGTPSAPIPPMLWNMRVVVTPAIDTGDVLILDSRYASLLDRMNVTAFLGYEDSDNLRRNMATLLVEGRWGALLLDKQAATKIVDSNSSSS